MSISTKLISDSSPAGQMLLVLGPHFENHGFVDFLLTFKVLTLGVWLMTLRSSEPFMHFHLYFKIASHILRVNSSHMTSPFNMTSHVLL